MAEWLTLSLQALNEAAFSIHGLVATRLELLGFALAVAMVACNIRVNPWAWPLAITSSLLYFVLFWQSRLYGEASLQLFFVAMAAWGWWQWLRGVESDGRQLGVRRLGPRGWLVLAVSWLVLWRALAWFLARHTDTDVPWWDAFTTSGSIVGTALLARKRVENWPLWIVVNAVSVGLFAHKGLWLTVVLYAVFIVMAGVGWRAWLRLAGVGAPAPDGASAAG